MMKLEIMVLDAKHLQKGDLVLAGSKLRTYLITDVGRTWFHRHKYFDCRYDNGEMDRIMYFNLYGEDRTVCRMIREPPKVNPKKGGVGSWDEEQ